MRISDWSSDVCSSDLVDGVISAIPVVEGQVMVTAHNTAVGGLVRGLRGEDLKRRPILANNIVAGSIENFDAEGGPLIEIGRAPCRERVCLRVDLGGRRIIKKKKQPHKPTTTCE